MTVTKKALPLMTVLALIALTGVVAAGGPRPTTISVEDMHCPNCAKKIVKTVSAVPGVAGVKADVESGMLAVAAREPGGPSPRALWEAVEKSGYRPTRLVGPSGTYTAKPQP